MPSSGRPADDHSARSGRSGDVGRSVPRHECVRLPLSIDVAAYTGGRSMWWLYRCRLQASRPTSTRLGRQRILPASAISASLQLRSADRRAAVLAVLDPEFVADFRPIAVMLWWTSSTSLIPNSAPDIVARLSLCMPYRRSHASLLPLNAPKHTSSADDPDVPPSVAASCRCIYMQAMATRDGTGLWSTLSGTCWRPDCPAPSRPAPRRRMPRSDAIWQHALQRLLPLRQDARDPALRAIAHVTNPSIGRAGSGYTARIDNNLSPLFGYRDLVRYFVSSCRDSLLHCATHARRDAPYVAPWQYRPLLRPSTLSSRLRSDRPGRRIDGPADRATQAAVPQEAGRDA